jgi:hypothetical protein
MRKPHELELLDWLERHLDAGVSVGAILKTLSAGIFAIVVKLKDPRDALVQISDELNDALTDWQTNPSNSFQGDA